MRRPLDHRPIDRLDRSVVRFMSTHGHRAERTGLALVFLWFGALKVLGHESATSIIAKTIYFGPPEVTVPVLGAWEMAIGLCFLSRRLTRVAIFLMAVRLPGTLLALVLRPEVCFTDSLLVPSIQGQYLIKDAALFGAALVIGSTVRWEGAKDGTTRGTGAPA